MGFINKNTGSWVDKSEDTLELSASHPPPINTIAEKVTIVYQLTGSFLRVDTAAMFLYDTLASKIVQYRLGSGRILPTNIFVAIYDFNNNTPDSKLEGAEAQPILSKNDWKIEFK